MKRSILIVLDGLGVGALPDADGYDDAGSDTLGHTARAVGGLDLPELQALGLGNLHAIEGVPPVAQPAACHGRLREISAGKDSTTGHWELLGVVTETPFPTYPQGFPESVIESFRRATRRGVLGNEPASGTEIIQRLGDAHVRTGDLIVYTSADSVFQIAAHEDVVPVAELYDACRAAREILQGPHRVSRVIARPFAGAAGDYRRTPRRRDFSVEPPESLVLHALRRRNVRVVAVGKIRDLFAGAGIDEHVVAKGNAEGMRCLDRVLAAAAEQESLVMLNLVDFDMLWGHRNDPTGMRDGLVEFDAWLGEFLPRLRRDDLLIMTADHGNDPTTPSTDHSREYVPLLTCLGPPTAGVDLGTRQSLADVGATLADFHGAAAPSAGASFWPDVAAAAREGRGS